MLTGGMFMDIPDIFSLNEITHAAQDRKTWKCLRLLIGYPKSMKQSIRSFLRVRPPPPLPSPTIPLTTTTASPHASDSASAVVQAMQDPTTQPASSNATTTTTTSKKKPDQLSKKNQKP